MTADAMFYKVYAPGWVSAAQLLCNSAQGIVTALPGAQGHFLVANAHTIGNAFAM